MKTHTSTRGVKALVLVNVALAASRGLEQPHSRGHEVEVPREGLPVAEHARIAVVTDRELVRHVLARDGERGGHAAPRGLSAGVHQVRLAQEHRGERE
jgi:hypothetical protein